MNLRQLAAIALTTATIHSAAAQSQPKPGAVAPEIKLEDSVRGSSADALTLSKLRGDVVYLEFWATWCGPCLASMPHLTALADEFKNEDIHFLLITDEKRATIERFLKRRELPGDIVLDTDKSIFTDYGIRGIPASIIIDRNGVVAINDHPSKVSAEMLRAVLAGTHTLPTPTPVTTVAGAPMRAATMNGAPASDNKSDAAVDTETNSQHAKIPKIKGVSPGVDPLINDLVRSGAVPYSTSEPGYTTIIRPTLFPDSKGAGATLGYAVGRRTGWAMTKIAASLTDVVKACKLQIRSDQRLIIEDGLDMDTEWDIILSRPKGWDCMDALDDLLKASERVMGFQVTERTANRPCLIPDMSNVVATDKIIRRSALDRTDPTAMSFQQLSGMARLIERTGGEFVADIEREDDPWLIDMYGSEPWNMKPAEVRVWLENAGMRFTVEQRPVTFTVVSPRGETDIRDAGSH